MHNQLFNEKKTYKIAIGKERANGEIEELFFRKCWQVKLIGTFPDEIIVFWEEYNGKKQQQFFPLRSASGRILIRQATEVNP